MKRYSKNGFYIEAQGDLYTIGLSAKGQDDSGNIIFASFDRLGDTLQAGDLLIGLEGAKSVSDLTSPLSGRIEAVHHEVEDDPDLLNSTDPAENWIIKLSQVDPAEFASLPAEMDPIESDDESQ